MHFSNTAVRTNRFPPSPFPWQFPVRNGRDLDLEIIVYDGESRPFDNFTSLHWEWSASDPSLISLPKERALKLNASSKSGGFKLLDLQYNMLSKVHLISHTYNNFFWYYS